MIAVCSAEEAGALGIAAPVEMCNAEISLEGDTLPGTAKACSVVGELAIQIMAVDKTSTRIVAALFKIPLPSKLAGAFRGPIRTIENPRDFSCMGAH